jgi:hypothetical protein
MSLWDYLLPNPLEQFKRAWKETKEAATDVKGKDKHRSVFSGFGRLTDPLSFMLGKDYTDIVHYKIPRAANSAMEPFVQAGHYGNPVYWYGKETDNDQLNWLHDLGNAKGADILATVLGGVAAGGAMGGAGGAGGAGAGGASGGSAGGASGGSTGGLFDFGSMDWTNPDTYMQFARSAPSGGQQQPQQQRYDSAAEAIARLQMQQREAMMMQEEEAQRAYLEQQQRLEAERARLLEVARRMYA